MTKQAYFEMCELLGNEPKDEDIPIELSDFPDLIQQILSIYSILKDTWDTMGGSYLGKDLTILPMLLDCYSIDTKDEILIVLDIVQYIDLVRYKLISSKQKASTSK